MGCFSWMYADLDNKKPLGEGMRAYIPCPDGTVIYEPGYELHGEFGGEDVYGLVASWNRLYLAMHPYFLIPQHRRIPVEDGTYKYAQPIPVFKFPWYKHYQDLSLTEDQVCKRWEEEMRKWDPEYPVELCEWRAIGIDIACYNDQNEKLPFPIKVCHDEHEDYSQLPASNNDPDQGWEPWDDTEPLNKNSQNETFRVCVHADVDVDAEDEDDAIAKALSLDFDKLTFDAEVD